MSFDSQKHFVIFDTNVLYHTYDKKADFSSFSFSGTFDNVINFINQLDIYEQVVVVIPTVVWREMTHQIIDAHQQKLREFREKATKQLFPEITVEDKGDINYSDYIRKIIKEYRENLSSNINTVIELQIASELRYKSIVERAFTKQPPFEGKDKKSDKGFKDALLWESILEFASQHNGANIIYYSKDNAFGNELEKEFAEAIPDATLTICSTESSVQKCLETWAKEIDIYSYTPIESYIEHKDLVDWLYSPDFQRQVVDGNYDLIEKSRLITNYSLELISFDNIEITNQTDSNTEYSVDSTLELTYALKNETQIKEKINATIIITRILEEIFTIDDIYTADEEDV